MRGGPAVEAAAVALNRGWAPMACGWAEVPDEFRDFAGQVLVRAQELHAQELKALAEAIGALTGNRVGEIVARAFG